MACVTQEEMLFRASDPLHKTTFMYLTGESVQFKTVDLA